MFTLLLCPAISLKGLVVVEGAFCDGILSILLSHALSSARSVDNYKRCRFCLLLTPVAVVFFSASVVIIKIDTFTLKQCHLDQKILFNDLFLITLSYLIGQILTKIRIRFVEFLTVLTPCIFCDAQCDGYVVNPFGNSNGLYIPNLFDNKPSKHHLDSKDSKKNPENAENIESGLKIWIRKFRDFYFNLFYFNCEQFLLNIYIYFC